MLSISAWTFFNGLHHAGGVQTERERAIRRRPTKELFYHSLVYLTLFLVSCGFVSVRGGRPERAGVAILLFGDFASTLAARPYGLRWTSFETGVFVVDVITLAGLICLALRTDRFWSIWATGFMLAEVGAHLARPLAGNLLMMVYASSVVFWFDPSLVALLIATLSRPKRRSWQGF